MCNIRALIVDDEPAARRRLRQFLGELPDVEIVGECENGADAVTSIRAQSPNLLLLDVQMPGMDGFGVIREVGAGCVPAVVFVTAYERFAVRAFEVHALDYVMKPFDEKRVHDAVRRARGRIESDEAGQLEQRLRRLLGELRAGPGHPCLTRLEVKSGGRVVFIPVKEIDWIGAADNYLEVHAGREIHMIRETMCQLESRLSHTKFARVHRSTLVNIDRVRELRPLFNKDHLLVLRDGTKLTVSRTYYEKLLSILRGG